MNTFSSFFFSYSTVQCLPGELNMQHACLRWDPRLGSNVIPMENLEGRISGEAHRVMVRSAADGGAAWGEGLEGWWNCGLAAF